MRWLGLVLMAVVVLYGQLMSTPFLNWDDDSNIFRNPNFLEGNWSVFWTQAYFGLYVPVTSLVWQVLYTLGKGSVWPFRMLNLVLHAINCTLLFFLLASLARRANLARSSVLVGLGVALFALHPLQVQAVAWISGGRDLLSAGFGLAAILVFFRFPGFWGTHAAALLFALSMLSKPSSVVLAVALPLLALAFEPKDFRRACIWGLAWLALAIFPIRMALGAQADFLLSLKWWERPLIMADSYCFYLLKLIWPQPLSANYGRPPSVVLEQPAVFFELLLVLGMISVLVWTIWRRDRRMILGVLWFLLLLPVSGLVPFGFQLISTTADHYHYLPMAVISALLVIRLENWRGRIPFPKMVLGLAILILMGLSWARLRIWQSDEAFFTDMKRTAPYSYPTGIGLSVVNCAQHANYQEGVHWTEVALADRPHDINALANQAFCYLGAKDMSSVLALRSHLPFLDLADLAVKRPTAYASFLASMGTALMETRNFSEGFQYLCEAFRLKPNEPRYKRNIEIAHQIMATHALDPTCRDFRPSITQ
ncbi:MAG: tetratricopeptide repeat protein [Bdellovibrionales bacterium]